MLIFEAKLHFIFLLSKGSMLIQKGKRLENKKKFNWCILDYISV